MKKLNVSISIVMMACLFGGCASYKARALPGVETVMATNSQAKQDVRIGAKFLSSADCKSIFGSQKITKQYQPVVIAIENTSTKPIVFRKDQMNKTAYPADQVATDCKFSTAGRATGYGVGALFFWPLLIPAIVDGVGSSNANEQRESDFALKEIQSSEIQPGMHLIGVAFLEKMNSGEPLVIKLFDRDQQLVDSYTFYR